ncbi:MAG: Channel protein, hemolysin III family [Candidatus Uhrbacteria bacterium GW2011_GWE2_45_35]|uniref:Channel protein, hemolysin III family n=2 Tax=Candidatus Uhriibacteriota TaxID=1752732 RepID=A0A0G1JJ04_9BACT|nr:MAG: Channel protein, hemolysin III family [Candidatus Uhrbacteria bacterium GW2011_GWF2_44_350]KKU08315.1 MAG: Channel protein, hemolysin III family [Candidatus Uhrbacteria bacterium GW2011_GWE2_45_35]HBR81024.1 hemolysin [Candidatus Uhrbacteria bacterium]HCU31820.1 hemolysin [Candidatus Uhrbacteria bacterium]
MNEPLSAITHLVAALLSVAGLVIMIVFAVLCGRPSLVVGSAIFGSSLILLYLISCFYHFSFKGTKLRKIFKRLDHSMIYVLIAGTYTPICLALPARGWGWSIFGVIWGLAVVGVILKATGARIKEWLSVLIYILMGWFIVVAFYPMILWLPLSSYFWLVLGGVSYTAGCLFYALDGRVLRSRWFGMHEIFHLFVMLGSFSHFWFIFRFVI